VVGTSLKESVRIAKKIMDPDNLEYSCKGTDKLEVVIKENNSLREQNVELKKQIQELQEEKQKLNEIKNKVEFLTK
jgi:hypothetical protein